MLTNGNSNSNTNNSKTKTKTKSIINKAQNELASLITLSRKQIICD